jgi:phenylacetate-coenzyme A ligase PaaK-like adenylate-forming protein
MDAASVFKIDDEKLFNKKVMEVFNFQSRNNLVYKEFINLLGVNPKNILTVNEIPFLPIQFFKSHRIISSDKQEEVVFLSSGTTGMVPSKHFVTDLSVYRKSYLKGFEKFYGDPRNYHILALLPSYLERSGSSLIYMVNDLIKKSRSKHSGFYLHNFEELKDKLTELERKQEKTILIGVSYALLDLIEKYQLKLNHTVIMETGGMKGYRKEMIKEELHSILKEGFGVKNIHSEYGMTELLSQAYSKGNGIFKTAPWMKILIRDTEDALTLLPPGKTGGINIIDLANINSCSFIATQDLGKIHDNNTFEVVGRFDNSDIRGCNLMVV